MKITVKENRCFLESTAEATEMIEQGYLLTLIKKRQGITNIFWRYVPAHETTMHGRVVKFDGYVEKTYIEDDGSLRVKCYHQLPQPAQSVKFYVCEVSAD